MLAAWEKLRDSLPRDWRRARWLIVIIAREAYHAGRLPLVPDAVAPRHGYSPDGRALCAILAGHARLLAPVVPHSIAALPVPRTTCR